MRFVSPTDFADFSGKKKRNNACATGGVPPPNLYQALLDSININSSTAVLAESTPSLTKHKPNQAINNIILPSTAPKHQSVVAYILHQWYIFFDT